MTLVNQIKNIWSSMLNIDVHAHTCTHTCAYTCRDYESTQHMHSFLLTTHCTRGQPKPFVFLFFIWAWCRFLLFCCPDVFFTSLLLWSPSLSPSQQRCSGPAPSLVKRIQAKYAHTAVGDALKYSQTQGCHLDTNAHTCKTTKLIQPSTVVVFTAS